MSKSGLKDVLGLMVSGGTPAKGVEHNVSISLISPDPEQPRKIFEETELLSLSESIKNHGLISPVLVRPDEKNEGQFILIAGERRWRAARLAGFEDIPIILKDANPKDTSVYALIENLHRADLNPMEIASGYERLAEKFNMDNKEIAAAIDKPRSSIANMRRLNALSAEIKEMIMSELISYGHAKLLLSVENEQERIFLADLVVKKGLSVRNLETYIKNMKQDKDDKSAIAVDKFEPHYKELLKKVFKGCGVTQTRKGATITIPNHILEDLLPILEQIKKADD